MRIVKRKAADRHVCPTDCLRQAARRRRPVGRPFQAVPSERETHEWPDGVDREVGLRSGTGRNARPTGDRIPSRTLNAHATVRRGGWALLSAMVAVVILSALAVGLTRVVLSSVRETDQREHLIQADQLAESALARAKAQLQKAPTYSGETWEPTNAAGPTLQATITIDRTGSGIGVRAECLVPSDAPRPVRVERTWTLPLAP